VIVDAVLALRRRGGATAGLTLVLAGVDRGLVDALHSAAAAGGARGGGRARRGERRPGWTRSTATPRRLVYPSLYEGFGLPVLEAMARGTAVIASRCVVDPEVLGDAGILVEPADVDGWTAALHAIIDEPARRAALAAAGMARAAGFTWARTAQATFEVYTRAVGR
jgi:alpha-1,3-rhamnosyl/mannosyltransferase